MGGNRADPGEAVTLHFCRAGLNIRGEHFGCDWPTNEQGQHPGWAHSNQLAQAIWADDTKERGQVAHYRLDRWEIQPDDVFSSASGVVDVQSYDLYLTIHVTDVDDLGQMVADLERRLGEKP